MSQLDVLFVKKMKMKLFNYFLVLLTVCMGCVSSEPAFWSNDRITNLTDIKTTVILWEKEAEPNYVSTIMECF